MTLNLRSAVYLFLGAAFVVLFVTVPQLATAQTFQSCSEAEAAGRTDIPASDPAYDESLDRDGDGIACESGDTGTGAQSDSDTGADAATPNRVETGGGYCALNDCQRHR